MNDRIDKWIDDHRDEMIEALQGALRFRTLETEPVPGGPFGRENRDCLEYTLGIAEKAGLKSTNMDGYCGYVDAGEGDEMLGILAHLDVVPEGTGWNYPPYEAIIADGNINARGAIDDKGPGYAALFALRAVTESGFAFRRRVRLIFGCNEERGMGCVDHYLAHADKIPDISFSPDGEFPLTNSEMSRVEVSFGKKFASSLKIYAGEAVNVVPGECTASVDTDVDEVKKAAETYAEDSEFGFVVTDEGDFTRIKVIGHQAHASMPDLGKNALEGMLELLSKLPLPEDDAAAVAGLYDMFRLDKHGESLGLDYTDVSGRQTMNPGIMRWDENGFCVSVDLRCPNSVPEEKLHKAFTDAFEKNGFEEAGWNYDKGFSLSEDSEIVKILMDCYKARTGLSDAKPLQIGGGTYARHLPNAVSFGPEGYLPCSEAHLANEFISIELLVFCAKLYADAIIALACK